MLCVVVLRKIYGDQALGEANLRMIAIAQKVMGLDLCLCVCFCERVCVSQWKKVPYDWQARQPLPAIL